MKVLLVEDNMELAGSISNFPEKEGYRCEASYTSNEAHNKLVSFQYDYAGGRHTANIFRGINREHNVTEGRSQRIIS